MLKCFAEICSTEANVPVLSAGALQAKYKEQYGHFEAVTAGALEKEGVPGRIIHHLRGLYKIRSNVRQWEIQQAINVTKFLANDKHIRVTHHGVDKDTSEWRLLGKLQLPGSRFFNPRVRFLSNKQEQSLNVKTFLGMRGLLKAVETGFTDAQYNHILQILNAKLLTAEDQQKVLTLVREIKDVVKSDKGKAKDLIRKATNDLPYGPVREYFFTLCTSEDLFDLVVVDEPGQVSALPSPYPKTASVVDQSPTKEAVQAAVAKALKDHAGNAEYVQILKTVSANAEEVFTPENTKLLDLITILTTAPEDDATFEKLLSIFEEDADAETLKIIGDALNCTPIAAKLFGNRMMVASYDKFHYTKKYFEGEDTLFPRISEDKTSKAAYDNIKEALTDGTLSPERPLFTTALDEIYQIKLERLAEYYGIDLQTDVGIMFFDHFMHNYDISHGEDFLDRVHPYPVPEHTYMELPIIKFDGFTESNLPEHQERALQVAAAQAGKTTPKF